MHQRNYESQSNSLLLTFLGGISQAMWIVYIWIGNLGEASSMYKTFQKWLLYFKLQS